MKNFLKILVIFLFAILANSYSSSSANIVPDYPETYIQNTSQKIVLVSENLNGAEIFSRDENTNQDFFVSRIFFTNTNSKFDELLINKSEKFANVNIHNLSTNNLKSKYIRAP